MKNKADYSLYRCPYEHIEKECGHKLVGPEGFQDTYGVWCECGFRGPAFILEPEELRLEHVSKTLNSMTEKERKEFLFGVFEPEDEPLTPTNRSR